MKAKFSELSNFVNRMTEFEQLQTIGGQGTPLTQAEIQKLFNFDSIGGINSSVGSFFRTQLEFLGETDIGSAVLHDLLNKANISPSNRITLTNTDPEQRNNAYFVDANGMYSMDIKYITPSPTDDVHYTYIIAPAFQVVSHELFHAYETIVKGQTGQYTVKQEIDANLFAAFAERATDIETGQTGRADGFYFYGANFGVSSQNDTPQHIAFKQAWDDIIFNKNFSLENYNNLIDNFKASQFNNNGTGRYNSLSADHTDSLTNTDVYNLFSQYYTSLDFSVNPYMNSGVNMDNPLSYYSPTPTGGIYNTPVVSYGGFYYGMPDSSNGYWIQSDKTGRPQYIPGAPGTGGYDPNDPYYESHDSSSW